MAVNIAKMAPTGAVVMIVGYCVWPYVLAGSTEADAKSAAKLPEISSTLLSPSIPPMSERDPYQSTSDWAEAKNNWNKSKTAEFKDRQKGNYSVPQSAKAVEAKFDAKELTQKASASCA